MPITNCKVGKDVKIPYPKLVNLYDCEIGDGTFIGPFVEIQGGVKIGKNCRIQSHTFICSHVLIGDDVFVGHGVIFINDKFPKANHEWAPLETHICSKVSIGSNATILPVTIDSYAMVGAGSVVTKDVKARAVVVGNPAKELG